MMVSAFFFRGEITPVFNKTVFLYVHIDKTQLSTAASIIVTYNRDENRSVEGIDEQLEGGGGDPEDDRIGAKLLMLTLRWHVSQVVD